MGLAELLLLAVGLAMDAFAVSLSNGLCYHNFRRSKQRSPPSPLAYFRHHAGDRLFCGPLLQRGISSVDHWIAFILLG